MASILLPRILGSFYLNSIYLNGNVRTALKTEFRDFCCTL